MIFENYDRVVFAGDSVTDAGSFLPVGEGLADSLGHGYVRKVENLLGAFYPDVFVRVTNAGVSGNTSRDLLARFQRDVLNLKPEWVCICIGINDIWRQFDCPAMRDYHVYPEEYEENLRNMLSELAGKTKGIFLMTPFLLRKISKTVCELEWMSIVRSVKSLQRSINAYLLICKEDLMNI